MALILFLDDDDLTLELMKKAAQLLKHQAVLCAVPEKALQAVREQPPDLIVADLSLLVEADLQSFVEGVRQAPGGADIPVVTISAGNGETDELRSHQMGAQQHLRKPLTLECLEKVVTQYTRWENGL